MTFPQRSLLFALLLGSSGSILRADVVADALLSFPAQTEYLEYDNLTALKKLPNYKTLRDEFSGKPLEEAKTVLGQLGIQEDQVQEIVTGSSASAVYGLVAGQFSAESAMKKARPKHYAAKLLDSQVFCTGRSTCIVFLEESLAAFGTAGELKNMLLARQGAVTRLTSNTGAVRLLSDTDRAAPVRGIIFGGQLEGAVSSFLPDLGGLKIDRSRLTSNVSGVGYSVSFDPRSDTRAHVSATLECASRATATMLSQVLSAFGALQSVAAPAVSATAGMTFEKVQVSSSGNLVHFQADSTFPGATPGGR